MRSITSGISTEIFLNPNLVGSTIFRIFTYPSNNSFAVLFATTDLFPYPKIAKEARVSLIKEVADSSFALRYVSNTKVLLNSLYLVYIFSRVATAVGTELTALYGKLGL